MLPRRPPEDWVPDPPAGQWAGVRSWDGGGPARGWPVGSTEKKGSVSLFPSRVPSGSSHLITGVTSYQRETQHHGRRKRGCRGVSRRVHVKGWS